MLDKERTTTHLQDQKLPNFGFWKTRYKAFSRVAWWRIGLRVFTILLPIIIGGFGKSLVPFILGALDIAFPHIHNIRIWLLPPSLTLLLTKRIVESGAGTEGTIYPPFSSSTAHRKASVDLAILRLHLAGIFSFLEAINLITSTINIRPVWTEYPSLFHQ